MRYYEENKFDNMSDEAIDEYFRPRKTNSTKYLLPLFIFSILKDKTDPNHRMSQSDIINELKEEPYSISVERKAVSRVLNQLGDFYDCIVTSRTLGYWYQEGAISE